MAEKKDLIIIGAGPGGYTAAIRASQLGRKVTVIEKEALGGVCLNWGCIPSKALLKTAKLFQEIGHAKEFGISVGNPKIDFPAVIKRSRGIAEKLSGGVQYLMKKNKVEVIFGTAQLLGGNNLSLSTKKGVVNYSYNDLILCTGGTPRTLPNIEVDGEVFHTSRTILESKRLPQKMLIVGAGAIGMEFAYFFHALGVQVTVVEMQDQILAAEDKEVADELQKIYTKAGMNIKTSASIVGLNKKGRTASCKLSKDGKEESWSGDTCLIAIGVIPNTKNLGLEEAGIETNDRGFVNVSGFMETTAKNHYAIGDIVGMPQLAHKASHEALIAAESVCGVAEHEMEYDNIPGCTYCQPQVASIGSTEKELKESGVKYKVGKMPFQAIGKAIAIGETDGFTKVLISETTGEILGAHIIHAEATELISELVLARTHEAIAESVLETIHPHPTLAESVMEAMAIALGRPINF